MGAVASSKNRIKNERLSRLQIDSDTRDLCEPHSSIKSRFLGRIDVAITHACGEEPYSRIYLIISIFYSSRTSNGEFRGKEVRWYLVHAVRSRVNFKLDSL